MGSRAKWEDMISGVFSSKDSKPEVKKASDAPVGDGMVKKTVGVIQDYKERQKQALKDAGVE